MSPSKLRRVAIEEADDKEDEIPQYIEKKIKSA